MLLCELRLLEEALLLTGLVGQVRLGVLELSLQLIINVLKGHLLFLGVLLQLVLLLLEFLQVLAAKSVRLYLHEVKRRVVKCIGALGLTLRLAPRSLGRLHALKPDHDVRVLVLAFRKRQPHLIEAVLAELSQIQVGGAQLAALLVAGDCKFGLHHVK